MSQIQLSQQIYNKVVEVANKQNQTPDQFVEQVLSTQLLPAHPYVEVIQSRNQPRPVIKGTRIGVDVIVGYSQAGYTPQEIAADILPHLTLAQLYDALSYYEDHRDQLDEMLKNSTSEIWQDRLKQRLGQPDAAQLLGQTNGPT
jgi:uncharacterized protein (DUF433 family)